MLYIDPTDQLNQEGIRPGFHAKIVFQDVLILEQLQRQAAAGEADVHQQAFFNLLPRARDGQLIEDAWRELLQRDPAKQIAVTTRSSDDALGYSIPRMNVTDKTTIHSGPSALRSSFQNSLQHCKTVRSTPVEAANSLEGVDYSRLAQRSCQPNKTVIGS